MRIATLLCLIILTVAGCKDSTGPATPSMTGSWYGNLDGVQFTMVTTANAGSFSGSGNLSGAGGAIALTVTGTHAHPSVSFMASASGYEDMNFIGTFTGDRVITGTFNGSGFNNRAISLQRQ